jgi:hypothetical protein
LAQLSNVLSTNAFEARAGTPRPVHAASSVGRSVITLQ